MGEMRLQKFLSAAGVCSRRKGEFYIAAGRVRVNREIITKPGPKFESCQRDQKLEGGWARPIGFP